MQTVNYEQPAAKQLVDKFEIQMPVVVLAKMKNGVIQDWKHLDEVWALVDDKPGFTNFVRGEINRMLATENQAAPASVREDGPDMPNPNSKGAAEKQRAEIPVP